MNTPFNPEMGEFFTLYSVVYYSVFYSEHTLFLKFATKNGHSPALAHSTLFGKPRPHGTVHKALPALSLPPTVTPTCARGLFCSGCASSVLVLPTVLGSSLGMPVVFLVTGLPTSVFSHLCVLLSQPPRFSRRILGGRISPGARGIRCTWHSRLRLEWY